MWTSYEDFIETKKFYQKHHSFPIIDRSMRRQMYHIANSLLSDPFGLMVQNAIMDGGHQARSHQDDMQMMPFAMPPLCLSMVSIFFVL